MLEALDLTKKFNSHVAVNQLNLRIAPGEIFALLGPNGAGKTTTINCFLGFLAVEIEKFIRRRFATPTL